MWSLNKKVDILVNILIFQIALNYLHYGQLLLIPLCFILFADNGFRFKVNSWFTFIVLCLFGLSFFVFSFKMGFYAVMGFTLPMVYYAGSNVKKTDEDSIKNLIYLIVLGMCVHLILNFGIDIYMKGIKVFDKFTFYDIWTRDVIAPTITAVNYTIPLALFYYVSFYEKSQKLKFIYFALIVIIMVYDISLGRRTPVMMFGVSVACSLFLDLFILKGKRKIPRSLIILALLFVTVVLILMAIVRFDLFGLRAKLQSITIIYKFVLYGIDAERLEIFINAVKLAPDHLWGGQEISAAMDIAVHDVWMDTFDYAGIVPFVFFVIYTVFYIKNCLSLFMKKDLSSSYKLLIITFFVCTGVQMMLEPIMTSSTIFLICTMLTGTVFEKQAKTLGVQSYRFQKEYLPGNNAYQ